MDLLREKGFTLVELLIVMLILGVLSTLAYFNMDFYRKARVDSRAKELYSDLQRARGDAITQGAIVTGVTITARGMGLQVASSTSYKLFVFSDNNNNYVYDATTEQAATSTRNLPGGQLSIVANSPTPVGFTDTIIFDRFGFPRQADWQVATQVTLRLSDTNLKVTYARCINITKSRIREGIWSGTTTSGTCTEQ